MKHLVVITRSNAAPRPSEAIIESDSDKVLSGQQTVQSTDEDNFFTLSGDITKNAVRLLSINDINPYGKGLLDGAAFYRYPHDSKITYATELRTWDSEDIDGNPIVVSAEAHVQYTTADSGGTNEYTTLEDAANFIGTLHASDGYVLLDRAHDAQVMETRPSLHNGEDDEMMGVRYDVDLSVRVVHPGRVGESDIYS